ncbi:MAG TPA: hypothetical protein PKY19_03335 [Oscillospiraceae bacterium]|nr:hypothetical protein [Oscillospiraceae bacterium]HXK77500.1 hypothetical protein [Oscillospiraceae bacterium]
MDKIQEEMKKSSRTVSIILAFALGIVIVAFLACAVGAVMSLALPDTVRMEFRFNPLGSAFDTGTSGGTAATLAILAWDLAMVGGVFIILLRMFREIRMGATPFAEKNVRRLKFVALLAVLMLNSSTIALGAAFWCIALIFSYGSRLQQQADETL